MPTMTKIIRDSIMTSSIKDFEAFLTLSNQSYKNVHTIKVESICPKVLQIQKSALIADLKKKNVNFSTVNLPTKKEIFTYLRSPFVHKKTKEQQIIKHNSFLIRIKQNKKNSYVSSDQEDLITMPYNTKSCIMTFYYHGN